MTAEELAEIRKRHERDDQNEWNRRFFETHHKDRAALLTHTDAQAQRIAELEAQLAARGPDREVLVAHFRSRMAPPFAAPETLTQENFLERWKVRADKKAREEADALLASGALATAQAERDPTEDVTITIPEADDIDAWVRFDSTREGPSERTHITVTAKMLRELGALATAQAVTLTEEEERLRIEGHMVALLVQAFFDDGMDGRRVQRLSLLAVKAIRPAIDRLTGASTPAQGDKA